MGIEPTWDAAQRPTLDLKSRRATSALSTSTFFSIAKCRGAVEQISRKDGAAPGSRKIDCRHCLPFESLLKSPYDETKKTTCIFVPQKEKMA